MQVHGPEVCLRKISLISSMLHTSAAKGKGLHVHMSNLPADQLRMDARNSFGARGRGGGGKDCVMDVIQPTSNNTVCKHAQL